MGDLLQLDWRQPLWGWLFLYPWVLWTWQGILSRVNEKGYSDPHLYPWTTSPLAHRLKLKQLWRHVAFILAWGFIAAAMAGPRVMDSRYADSGARETQLLVVVDVSRSMNSKDVLPSRMESAKLAIEKLIDRVENERLGLILFAAAPHLMTPLTSDKSVLKHDLALVHHGLLPTEGSNPSKALRFAMDQFQPGDGARALLLVTDGEVAEQSDNAVANLNAAAVDLAQQGIVVYTLGVGTTEGAGVFSPQGGWLTHRGRAVVSRLHEARLQRIAVLGNGAYARVSANHAEWRELYDSNIKLLYSNSSASEKATDIIWRELYGWFLVPGVALLLLVYVHVNRKALAMLLGYGLIIPLFSSVVSISPAQAGQTEDQQRRAYEAYSNQSYVDAKQIYSRLSGYVGRMGEGSSAYRLGDYVSAIEAFTQAVLKADNDQQRAHAIFNLADSYYQLHRYDDAISLYKEVLRYDSQYRGAVLNLALSIKLQKSAEEERLSMSDGSGRGPRSGRVEKNREVKNASLHMDEELMLQTEQEVSRSAQAKESGTLGQDIYYSQPIVREVIKYDDSSWQYAKTSASAVLMEVDSLRVDESIVWKRIFEGEEKIPAPRDVPETVPGILPW